MTRRQFLISIAVVGWLGVRPARGRAQDERDVYGDVVKWLKTLFRPLSEIGELIDQTRFVASLTDLATTFEAMLNDTREIVEILERPQLDRYALTQVGTRLSERVGPCSAQLTDVAHVLRPGYREQGERTASDLPDAVSGQGTWLAAILSPSVPDHDVRRLARNAKGSAKSLGRVTSELRRLIAFILSHTDAARGPCKGWQWRKCPENSVTEPSLKRHR